MAFIHCGFYSKQLNGMTAMNVILPQRKEYAGEKLPTLYLLHGYSDDYTAWQRKTAIERYVSGLNLCVVMPDAQKSFYTDFYGINSGYRYWQFVNSELLDVTRQFFHLSHNRQDTFVAGLSMGGFGAFKLALNMPETFAAAASFSGSLDIFRLTKESSFPVAEFNMLAGNRVNIESSADDLFHVATSLASSAKKLPRLFQCCGTEDFLYDDNLRFKKHLETIGGFDLTYSECHGGHNWEFWDAQLKIFLDWLAPERIDAYK